MRRGRPRHDDILTPREWQVLGLLREGLTNDQIAERLAISHDTAKFHVSEILGKLGVESRHEAASWQPDAAPTPRRALPALALPFGLRLEGAGRAVAAGVIGAAAVAFGLLAAGVFLTTGRDVDDSLGKIAFVRDGDIWVRALPEGTPWRLTDTGDASRPRWSPSGEWLLYSEGLATGPDAPFGLATVVSADGATQHRVDTNSGFAGWAWDDRLVYERDGLFVMSTVSGHDAEPVLWPYPGRPDGALMGVFPLENGRWMAMGFPNGTGAVSSWTDDLDSFWIVSNDGSDASLVFSYEPEATRGLVFAGVPTENHLLLWDPNVDHPYQDLATQDFATFAVSLDGGELQRLSVRSHMGSMEALPLGDAHIWTDGEGGVSWTQRRIGLLDIDAPSFTPLTSTEMAAISPAVSPDESLIAYVAAPDLGPEARGDALRQRRIWLMDADGSNQRPVTEGTGFRDEAPQWSADGSHILFARISGEDFCDTSEYDLMLYSLESDSVELIEAGLPLFGTRNELPVVREIPVCTSEPGPTTTDYLGVLNLGPVLDWWQPQP